MTLKVIWFIIALGSAKRNQALIVSAARAEREPISFLLCYINKCTEEWRSLTQGRDRRGRSTRLETVLCRSPSPGRQREIQARAKVLALPVSLGRALVEPAQKEDKIACQQEGFSLA